jgi:hypothetical protein
MMSSALGIEGTTQAFVRETVGGEDLCAASAVRAPKKDVGSDHLPLCVLIAL